MCNTVRKYALYYTYNSFTIGYFQTSTLVTVATNQQTTTDIYKFYKSVARPAILYSSECCWAVDKNVRTCIAEMITLRRLSGLTRIIRNEYVRGSVVIVDTMREYRL